MRGSTTSGGCWANRSTRTRTWSRRCTDAQLHPARCSTPIRSGGGRHTSRPCPARARPPLPDWGWWRRHQQRDQPQHSSERPHQRCQDQERAHSAPSRCGSRRRYRRLARPQARVVGELPARARHRDARALGLDARQQHVDEQERLVGIIGIGGARLCGRAERRRDRQCPRSRRPRARGRRAQPARGPPRRTCVPSPPWPRQTRAARRLDRRPDAPAFANWAQPGIAPDSAST